VVYADGAAAGIGNYNPTSSAGTFTLNGDGVVITNSISDQDKTRRTRGILFSGDECFFYGTHVTASYDLNFPAELDLFIGEGQTLTLENGASLTNAGTVSVSGALSVDGNFTNSGTVLAKGDINTYGTTTNTGDITVYGFFYNHGTFINKGTINGAINGNQVENEIYYIDLATVDAAGAGYAYDNGLLTLNSTGATYYLSGTTTTNRVAVAANKTVTIVLNNTNITSTDAAAFTITAGATATIVLEGTNSLTSGGTAAGLAVPVNATLYLEGKGSLTATAADGSGIGSTGYYTSGKIYINSGIINASSTGAAGIGGVTGAIYINGGVVTASAPTGKNGIGGTFKMAGNGVLFTSSYNDKTTKAAGIIFATEEKGTFFSSVNTPTNNLTIPTGKILQIDNGKTLTVKAGQTLVNKGTIIVYGDLIIEGTLTNNGTIIKYGEITGTVEGAAVTIGSRASFNLNLSTLTAGAGYTLKDDTVVLNVDKAKYTLTGSGKAVEVAPNIVVDVTLNNVNIVTDRAFYINPASTVNLHLEGENVLTSTAQGTDFGYAGLGTPKTATVIIDGDGVLTATGDGGSKSGGAGIGGTKGVAAGTIIINGGSIYAYGNCRAAGIGGGYMSGYEAIEINGGFVTATGVSQNNVQGDGIGGYSTDNTSTTGLFTMNGNAVVVASSVRDASEKNGGLLISGSICQLYGKEATISDNVTIPYGAELRLQSEQTLNILAGDTLFIPTTGLLEVGMGANLNNDGVIIVNHQGSVLRNGNLSGSGKTEIPVYDYDNRDRLYFHFHILANCLYDGSVTTTLNANEIQHSRNQVIEFENFIETHAPYVNAVTKTTLHEEVTHAQGTGNDNRYSGTAPLDPYCMDHFIAKATGSPSYAAYYIGDYIHLREGWTSWTEMHEYGHHVERIATHYNQDDGQPWEHLFLRYDTMELFNWAIVLKDAGELWKGSNQWLYEDTLEQVRPQGVVFPTSATLDFGKTLEKAVFSGYSGDGTFKFSNYGYGPYEHDNGRRFKMTFFPSDPHYHIITEDVPVTFTGTKLDAYITVSQNDVYLPGTVEPYVATSPAGLAYTVEYKQQGAENETYTTTVPTEPGKYTVRASFAGNNDLNAARDYENFTIYDPTAIKTPSTEPEQARIFGTDGFIVIRTSEANLPTRIYTIAGALHSSKNISSGETIIPARRGLYIVTCGNTRKKIIVR